MMKTWTLAIACVLVFSGCASTTKAPPAASMGSPGNAQAAWQKRQATFARMTSWRMQGRVGVQLRDQSASFGISWLQQGNGTYEMNIKNPLTGAVVAFLEDTGSGITLKSSDGETYHDANAESLLRRQLGVALPLTGMSYWVRGVASPKDPLQQLKLDGQGRPQSLQQAGWVVNYTAWQGNGWNALPTKIQLTRAEEQAKVKVIAKDWQTRY